MIFIWLALTILGAVLYRMGGAQGYNTKWRDCGVSLVVIAMLTIFKNPHGLWQWLSLLPTFGLTWGALTSYHYFLPKPPDYTWPYYMLHGFICALASVCFAWATGLWWLFALRILVASSLAGFWSWLILNVLQPRISWKHWDVCHECGRGAIITGCAVI